MRAASLCAWFAVLVAVAGAAHADITFDNQPDTTGTFILDVRSEAECERASLAGASCLATNRVLGPNRRLPNVSGLLWLLGTVGLTGDEHVVIVGDSDEDKTFMAGLLYLTGQKKITVMTQRLSELKSAAMAPGAARSRTRQKVFQAPMRDDSVILRRELLMTIAANQPVTIVDMRSEAEYWGRKLRAPRGGHIPGAILFSPDDAPARGSSVIIYGHDTVDGLVALARLVSQGGSGRALMDGWAGWAADGALPVDALTFADTSRHQPQAEKAPPPAYYGSPRLLIAAGVLVLIAFSAGYFVRWLTAGKKE